MSKTQQHYIRQHLAIDSLTRNSLTLLFSWIQFRSYQEICALGGENLLGQRTCAMRERRRTLAEHSLDRGEPRAHNVRPFGDHHIRCVDWWQWHRAWGRVLRWAVLTKDWKLFCLVRAMILHVFTQITHPWCMDGIATFELSHSCSSKHIELCAHPEDVATSWSFFLL